MDGRPAKTRQRGNRIEALYGGSPRPDSGSRDEHSHLASNDGYNLSYLREFGEVIVDNQHPHDPYNGGRF